MASARRHGAAVAAVRLLFIAANRLGDAVLSTGILGALLDRHPGAEVTIACGPVAAGLFAAVPGLKRLVVLEKRRLAGHWLGLWRIAVGTRWDLVVDLRNSAVSYLVRADRRIMHRGRRDDSIHVVEECGRLVGIAPPPAPRLWLDAAMRARAADLVPDGPPVLAVAPTANWRGKEWRQERFADLLGRLTAADAPFAGHRIAVFGTGEERGRAAPVLGALPGPVLLDLMGRTDPATAAACLKRCRFFIGLDSGLMHMAAAAGLPTVALFGPGWPARYGPWGRWTAVASTTVTVEQMLAAPGYDHRTTDTLMDSLSVDAAEAVVRRLYDEWCRARAAERTNDA